MTKPREWWIPAAVGGFYDGKQVNFAVGPIVDGPLPNPGGIKVREVLPDEPDWRALAEEMAEALKVIRAFKGKTLLGRCCTLGACVTDEDGCSARVTAANAFYGASRIASTALQKFEQAVKNE